MRPGYLIPVLLLALAPARANDDLPGEELLEFLADWRETDAETFELLVVHGVRDVAADAEAEDDEDQ